MPLIRQEHYSFHIVIIGYSRVAVAPVPGNLIHGLYEALGVNFVYRRTTRMESIRFDESLSFTPIDQLLRQNGIKAISQLIELGFEIWIDTSYSRQKQLSFSLELCFA
ncbi:hypothetical protein TMatcc_000532 [Talaromyces marneffei ATCC 18224]